MDSEKTAFLVMDVQPGVVDRLQDTDGYLTSVQEATEAARSAGHQIIYVVVSFQESYPEISPNNRSFSAIKQSGQDYMINSRPSLQPKVGDIVIRKHRVSAFSGSDLDMILRAQNITHLVLSGIATSGVVLATVVEAADKDYKLTVLKDLCVDFDNDMHTFLMDKFIPKRGNVTNWREWLDQD